MMPSPKKGGTEANLSKLHNNWDQLPQFQRWKLFLVAMLFIFNNYLQQKAQTLLTSRSSNKSHIPHP